jgi:hypothetical protein
LPAIIKGIIKLLNGLMLHDVRHIPVFAINIITLADLRAYRPAYDWKNAEWLLNIGNNTIRVAEESRLWPILFRALLSSKRLPSNGRPPSNKKSPNNRRSVNKRPSSNRRLFLECQKLWYHAMGNIFPNDNSDDQKKPNHYNNNINV